MDLSQYLEIFIDETKEHLQTLNDQVLIMEQDPNNSDTVNEIFRAAHSLKGMAGTMGFKRMQRLTHDLENVFSEIRNGKISVTPDIVDIVFKCLDALEGYLANIQDSADEGTEDNEEIINLLNAALESSGSTNASAEDSSASESDNASNVAKETPAGGDAGSDSSNNAKAKFLTIPLADFEIKAMKEAVANGMHVYGATVYIQETCILKAARAFLVFKGIESVGEVAKSEPVVQDIEDEKFDFDFSVFVISDKELDQVEKVMSNVSEIQEVVIEEFDPDTALVVSSDTKPGSEESAAEQGQSQVISAPAEGTPATASKKEPAEKKGAETKKKPVVNRSVRVDIEKLDDLMNLVSELIIAKNGLVSVSANEAGNHNQQFNEQIEYLERITTNLHESVMKVRMVPIESVVNRFPRMIRDISKKLNKEMELIMTGEETELDRTVIDEIGDPLMHMLRNAADHGLESTLDRIKLGKPKVGTIRLNAYQDGNNVTIEVSDDGKGVDAEKVKASAVKKGTITEEQAEKMSDKDAIDLLFRPAFSTAEKVSDLSGRGVGLDVVKSKIEGLGGDVEVSTVLGEGTTFTVRLPLTLAIIQALMVDIREEKYAIPLSSIVTVEDVPASEVKMVQNKEVINLRGNVIPLIRLSEELDFEPLEEAPESLVVVIVKKGDKTAGLVIDNLIGQQEIVIKPLGKYIYIHKMFSGATILGDGEVALILDTNTLL